MRMVTLALCLALMAGCAAKPAAPPASARPAPPVQQPAPPATAEPPGPKPEPPAPAPAPSPGVTVWAVDVTGARPPEELWAWPEPLLLLGTSPDGRHWLLEKVLGQVHGDPRGFAYLYDRQTGRLREGPQLDMHPRAVAWSGQGFWVGWLIHLDLDLKADTYPHLREALELGAGRQLLGASFSRDGRRVAALVDAGGGAPGPTASLVLAGADGTGLVRVAGSVQPWTGGKSGPYAQVALSPAGERAILLSQSPGYALVDTAAPARDRWQPLLRPFTDPVPPGQSTGGPAGSVAWAPDGQHAWLPPQTILTRTGAVRATLAQGSPVAVWNRDGTALAILGEPGAPALRLVTLNGQARDVPAPGWVQPVAFLPDGRLLVSHTVVP